MAKIEGRVGKVLKARTKVGGLLGGPHLKFELDLGADGGRIDFLGIGVLRILKELEIPFTAEGTENTGEPIPDDVRIAKALHGRKVEIVIH